MSKRHPEPHTNGTIFLRHWRIYRGYQSQGDLAKATGITRATISRLENNKLAYKKWHLDILAPVLICKPGDIIDLNPYGPNGKPPAPAKPEPKLKLKPIRVSKKKPKPRGPRKPVNTKLAVWMREHKISDEQLAALLNITRVQANRIKRGKSAASPKTARRIGEITGLEWQTFLNGAGG